MTSSTTSEPGDSAGSVTVTPCPDGPLIVRGDVTFLNPDGSEIPRNRKTVALCRCGGTGIPPWCDGTHKVLGYRTAEKAAR